MSGPHPASPVLHRASPRTAAISVMGAAVLFGTSATSLQLLAPDAPPASVAALRLLVGSAGLLAFVALRGGFGGLVGLWRLPSVWLMGLAVAGYQALFFLGTASTGVAIGTLISLGVAPFLAGIIGWLAREGAPGWLWAGSTVIAILGLGLLMVGSLDSGQPGGMAAAAGAGACYAMYTVLGVRLSRADHAPSAVLAASFSVGAVLLLPAVMGTTWWLTASGAAEVLWLGLVTTTAGYLLFGVGLRVLQPGHIATLTLLEPAVATLLGVVVLHEVVSATGWIGCLLILGALALLGLGEGRARRSTGVTT
ncbi:MAG: EamA family transporter [Actinomycetota bacterium]|nr:EamA family transporter [Actinomycetota bacterium]